MKSQATEEQKASRALEFAAFQQLLAGAPDTAGVKLLRRPPVVEPLIKVRGEAKDEFAATPGLHIVAGRTGSGKTIAMYALHEFLVAHPDSGASGESQLSSYLYIGEPGDTKGLMLPPIGVARLIESEPFLTAPSDSKFIARYRTKVLIIDSLTYYLSSIGSILIGDSEDVTYEKGLRMSDLLAIRYLDTLARRWNTAVYAVLNADLFPRSAALEGACEGSVTVHSYQSFSYRNRATRRETLFTVPKAREVLQSVYEVTPSELGLTLI